MWNGNIVRSAVSALAAAFVVVPLWAHSQEASPGTDMGPGMTWSGHHATATGQGAPAGWGSCGTGPWMAGGSHGMGAGMMGEGGGYAMGPGMMGGWGDGRTWGEMMAGHGMGPGLVDGYGMGAIWRLDLTDTQRSKINVIADQLRTRHWAIMGKVMEDRTKLRDLYSADEPDPKAVGAVYGDLGKLREQMAEAHVQARNQAWALLTKEQREQLQRWRRTGWRQARADR